MNKTTIAAKNDFLGVVAIGSVIGNLVQADERTKLQGLYRQLISRYELLLGEYQAFRQVNINLEKQVAMLREENNKLRARPVAKDPAK